MYQTSVQWTCGVFLFLKLLVVYIDFCSHERVVFDNDTLSWLEFMSTFSCGHQETSHQKTTPSFTRNFAPNFHFTQSTQRLTTTNHTLTSEKKTMSQVIGFISAFVGDFRSFKDNVIVDFPRKGQESYAYVQKHGFRNFQMSPWIDVNNPCITHLHCGLLWYPLQVED